MQDILSADEKRVLDTPIKDLSRTERELAFSLIDKIAGYNMSEDRHSPSIPKVSILDKDKLLANGVLSPLDQKTAFHNRRDWGDHLRRNGCVEIGNDFNNSATKKREIVGDFNCREELSKATYQVMEKYGH